MDPEAIFGTSLTELPLPLQLLVSCLSTIVRLDIATAFIGVFGTSVAFVSLCDWFALVTTTEPAWHHKLRTKRSFQRSLLQAYYQKPSPLTLRRIEEAAYELASHHGSKPPTMPKWTKQQWAKWNSNWNQQHSSVPNDANLTYAGIKGMMAQMAKQQRSLQNFMQ